MSGADARASDRAGAPGRREGRGRGVTGRGAASAGSAVKASRTEVAEHLWRCQRWCGVSGKGEEGLGWDGWGDKGRMADVGKEERKGRGGSGRPMWRAPLKRVAEDNPVVDMEGKGREKRPEKRGKRGNEERKDNNGADVGERMR
ncbi:hypothetical protein B0H11DRAFT_1919725, partial [Mycena galericulata]